MEVKGDPEKVKLVQGVIARGVHLSESMSQCNDTRNMRDQSWDLYLSPRSAEMGPKAGSAKKIRQKFLAIFF